MRVLSVGSMFPPHHLGGYELTWRSAMLHLEQAGHEVLVLCSDLRLPRPEPGDWDEPGEVRRELRWYWDDYRFPRRTLREALAIERHNLTCLDDTLERFRPEVINWWAMGGMSMSLVETARRRGAAAVGIVGDNWLEYGPRVDGWQAGLRRRRLPKGLVERLAGVPARLELGSAAEWLFVSEAVRKAARRAGWIVPRSSIARGGVDTDLFEAQPRHEWRGRLLYVGRLDPRKGVEVAIRAVAELEGMTLQIVGPGESAYVAELQQLIDTLGLRGRVEFAVRSREQLPATYAEADAVLFPVQWEEPSGLVPLEAMAVGRPVVASGSGGSGEYLVDGDNCLIFAPRQQPAALAAAVARLAADPELRERLVAGGGRTAGRYTERAYNEAIEAALLAAARRC